MHGLFITNQLASVQACANQNQTMKKFIVQTMLLLGFVFSYQLSYAQTPATACPKKGTVDCPLVKNCPKKGTKDCPYAVSTVSNVSKNVNVDCPYKGTDKCPLVKCPLRGTPACPLVNANGIVSFASNKTAAKSKEEDDLPPCCRKAN